MPAAPLPPKEPDSYQGREVWLAFISLTSLPSTHPPLLHCTQRARAAVGWMAGLRVYWASVCLVMRKW